VITTALPPQGYRITITSGGASIEAGDEAGLHYARITLGQLAGLHHGELPIGSVEDYPDIPVRGVMLDISRDKIPRLDTLMALIDRLSSWKFNHVQLYMEHTFAYQQHSAVHRDASPLTGEEIKELDAFCRQRHVELAPNQNCLGHMERWLKHPGYHHLAITSEGSINSLGIRRPPMTLQPRDPRSFTLVAGLLEELLPWFSSRRVHVGLDETWELPPDRLGELLNWMGRLRDLQVMAGREMLVWGDMLWGRRDLLAQLPDGITVCEWGYEATHEFNANAKALAGAGVKFWVSPGTSSWLSILGRTTNARINCLRAAEAAVAHGASGYLVTDWGDNGHLQQPAFSDPALAFAAGVSWCLDSNCHMDLARVLDLHCYKDASRQLGDSVLALGDACTLVTPQPSNMSALTMPLYYPQFRLGEGVTAGLSAQEIDRVKQLLQDCKTRVATARPMRGDADILLEEILWSIELMDVLMGDASGRLQGNGAISGIPRSKRDELAARTDALLTRHRDLWLKRNRPGGLADSCEWLQILADLYRMGGRSLRPTTT
jgi:hypothetical protein